MSPISSSEAPNTLEYKNYFSIIDNFIVKNKNIKKYVNDLKKENAKMKDNFSYISNNNKFKG